MVGDYVSFLPYVTYGSYQYTSRFEREIDNQLSQIAFTRVYLSLLLRPGINPALAKNLFESARFNISRSSFGEEDSEQQKCAARLL
ncbi:uncharacterized protein PHALS_11982 [Plasmopara halstedii]|uniref:Uncharacterized protein n=1 Tax=Plasmopara halstedii TaxID=4781 RepID=A0A0P1AKK0_PLAHL|nr:uncharacterized protein PHALS_11982 [Plasmopara halstedii]CEG41650.1 hypothetical protein PHALS_11982 [Plasmopara halstedii]|eukprot:XP_024578019.1 hypothetical protein PHALS_11982 [Plasmopara halstedii]